MEATLTNLEIIYISILFLFDSKHTVRTPNAYTVRENSVEFGLFVYRLGRKIFILETRVRLSYRPQYINF